MNSQINVFVIMNLSSGNCCVIAVVIMTLLIVEAMQQSIVIDYNIKIYDYTTWNRQIYNNLITSVCLGQISHFAGWRMYWLAARYSLRMFSVIGGSNTYFMQFIRRRIVLIRGYRCSGLPTLESFYSSGANTS